jgi:ATP-dependent Lon protease
MECLIPTSGVYPIATANYKDKISAPLLSRFAVIDIPDYTRAEKKTILSRFALPKVLKRLGLHENECIVSDEALDVVLDVFKDTTGIRDLEQAAEHLAAHALYMIEVEHAERVVYDADMARELFS